MGERDESGRFLPGNQAAKGNTNTGRKTNEARALLRDALDDIISQNGTLREWKEAMRKKLRHGDSWATEFVFDRLEGKAISKLELSGDNGGPVEIRVIYDAKDA